MSAPKLNPPFKAEHLGSLLRPDYLLAARKQFDKKEISASELKEFEDKAIAEAVKLQKGVGLKGLTDGEYRY
jgi:methionine synthase II (cobalamin-independent)